MPRVAIMGTTTWGVTLGVVLARNGVEVSLWARTERESAALKNAQHHSDQLSGISLPSQLATTSSLSEALSGAKAVILAVPSQKMRENIKAAAGYLDGSILVVSAAKGLEIESGQRMSQVISDEINPDFWSNICVHSGPNLAQEILHGLPAVAVVAAWNETVAMKAQKLLNTPTSVFTPIPMSSVSSWEGP